ncbi:helix-turn-helix transcriptional regulator [Pseudomonas zeae]|uniref:Helix-turn-helix transcriptional regulator n=2 Tax=Pseudomonas zeae TaxID=2745510 RepID=A0A9E6NJZ9_9PSED|nr:helix-turn-helix transcriptional regulator [Pseudomonas zeae]
MRHNFSLNLKHLCSHYRSISEVCRKLGMHRGQFNKYLNGASFPTSFNLKRICDFFGVDGYEIALPADQFTLLISDRQRKISLTALTAPQRAVEHLRECSSQRLQNMVGYYHEYSHSVSNPGSILCTLVKIHEAEGHFVYTREERSSPSYASMGDIAHYRYEGVVYYLGDRLFLVDYESMASSEINLTILIPNLKRKNERLNGMKMSVTPCDRRAPVCSQVIWTLLGKEICYSETFRSIREYKIDDPDLNSELRSCLSVAQLIEGVFRVF